MEEGIYTAKYIGKPMCGLKQEQQYVFKLSKPLNRNYELLELEDNICITYASANSINRNWSNIVKED